MMHLIFFWQVLTPAEEEKIVAHCLMRTERGFGLTVPLLRTLIQSVLQVGCASNPERLTGYEAFNQLPPKSYVQGFRERHKLVLRATMEVNQARAVKGIKDMIAWQRDTRETLVTNPKFAQCFNNGMRIFNMDETPLQVGASKMKVLTKKGYPGHLSNFSGGSREHVSLCVTISGSGHLIVRLIYKGKNNVAKKYLW